MTPQNIIVIGAGAAGMIAASEAAARGARVKLLEKNGKTGVKILNVGRHALQHHSEHRRQGNHPGFWGSQDDFCRNPSEHLDPPMVVAMFHSCGVATKVEPTGKVFPTSDRALDVRNALERQAIKHGVEILLRTSVQQVQNDAGAWNVHTSQGTFSCDRLIVTAGGKKLAGLRDDRRRLQLAAKTRTHSGDASTRPGSLSRWIALDARALWIDPGQLRRDRIRPR